MAYTQQELDEILALQNSIDANRDKYRSVTFRDKAALSALRSAIDRHPEPDARMERWQQLRFLADAYHDNGRFGMAARTYMEAIDCACEIGAETFAAGEMRSSLEMDLHDAAALRNVYAGVHDACLDLAEKAAPLLGAERAAEIVGKALNSRHLRYDPVEDTADFLALIDDIEEQIDKELGSDMYMGKCHAIWSMKKELLEDFGIEWLSPARINGGTFD